MKFKHEKMSTRLPLGPMIDAVFLLLSFFLVTTNFTPLEGMIHSPLPKDQGDINPIDTPDKIEPVKIFIDQNIDGTPQLRYNDAILSDNIDVAMVEIKDNLKDFCAQAGKKAAVIIIPSNNVHFQHVVSVFSACEEFRKETNSELQIMFPQK